MDGDINSAGVKHDECIETRIDKLSSLLHGQAEDGVRRFLIGHDGLLDALLALYAECNKEQLMKNKHVSTFVNKYRSTVREIQRLRINVRDFEVKDVIGRGHFGEVQVVRESTSGTVYAMKTLRKAETLSQPDIAFFEEERDIMAQAASPWITQLHYAFQDASNLYLVMEFHPGGDLLSLLSRYDDVFEEDMARFYLAEVTMAINDLHCLGYVHRDIKPENVLVDRNGHIKLADFGSAAKLSIHGMVMSKMPVGTPDYVSPELLVAMNSSDGMSKYGVEVDWWSLGICAYEMLFGTTPFTDENGSMVTTYSNIMSFKTCLKFPEGSHVSSDALSCIRGLLSTAKERLRFKDICCLSFFKNTDFQHIRDKNPPFTPTVNGQDDTSNFEDFEKLRPRPCVDDFRSNKHGEFSGKDLPFVGFTYTKDLFTHTRIGDMSQFSTYCILENPVPQSSSTTTTTSTTATVTTSGSPACSNLEVKLTVKIQELQHVKERCHQLEETETSLKSNIHEMEQSFRQKDDELKAAELSKSTLENDLERYIQEYHSMKASLDQILDGKDIVDVRGVDLYHQIAMMREEFQQIERLREIDDQQLRSEAEDLRAVVSQLEVDREDLRKRLARKQRQLGEYTCQLEASQKRVTEIQINRDKERRRSREMPRQEFKLCQQGEEFWKSQLQERADQIDTLQGELQTLQTQVESYKCKEMVLTETEIELQDKVTLLEKQNKELLLKLSSSGNQHEKVADLENALETKDQEIKELNDAIVKYKLKEGQYEQESRTEEKIKEIIDRLDKHRIDERTWRRKERELNEKIKDLENRLDLYRSKGLLGVSSSGGDSHLYDRLTQYQTEVQEQKKIIRELKDKVQTCIDNEKRTTSKDSVLQTRIKELEEHVCTLQTEKSSLQTKGDKHQQKIADKDRMVTEFEGTISLLNLKVSQLERQIKDLNKTKREELVTTTSIKSTARERLEERKLTALREEKTRLEVKVTDLESQLRRAKTKTDTTPRKNIEKKLENVEKEKTELYETVSKLRKDMLKLKSEQRLQLKSDSSTDYSELKLKIETLQSEVEELKSRLKSRDEDVLKLEEDLTELRQQLAADRSKRKQDEKEKSAADSSELERTIDRMEEEGNEAKKTIDRLKKELDKAKHNNRDWQSNTFTELQETVKNLRQELSDVRRKKSEFRANETKEFKKTIKDLQEEVEKLKTNQDKHSKELNEKDKNEHIEELNRKIEGLQKEVSELRSSQVNQRGSESDVVNSELYAAIRTERDELEARVIQLEEEMNNFTPKYPQYKDNIETKESSPTMGLNSVSIDFKVTVEDITQESAQLKDNQDKAGSGYRYATKSRFSDLKQYNAFLETRVEHLQKELEDALKNTNGKYRVNLEKQIEKLIEEKSNLETNLEKMEEELTELRRQDRENAHLAKVKEEKIYLETKVSNLEKQVTELKNQGDISHDQVSRLQGHLREQVSGNDDKVRELEQRYHDANLCVSEARAQVSSLQRREKSLQEQLDALQKRLLHGVQDIEDRLQQAQLEKRQAEEAKSVAVQEKEMSLQQLERELKLTRSQHEKSSRQYQDLEERINHVAQDKGKLNMNLQTLRGELATKTHQCELETKKVGKLMGVCTELEAQIFDLEALNEHYEKKEKEWSKIRHKYERAVDEREEQLEGTSHRLESEQKAKLAACDKVKYMKQKLDNSKAMQRMEMDSMSEQLKEAHRTIEKLNARVGEFESTSTKLGMILKSQKDNLDTETREQNKLKEEISRYITENQKLRESNLKLTHNLEEAMDKFELIFGEKVDLENIMEKLQGWHFLEKYRFESHSEQLFKLIDHLQAKKETNKKKGKFSFRSKDMAAGGVPMQYKELNNALDMERKRCVKLQEQVDKLRQDNFKQSSELLQLKGPLLEKVPLTVPSTPINKNTLSAITNSPSSQLSPIPLMTPKVNRGQIGPTAKTPQPAKQRMRHNIPHKFVKGLNTRATKCAVCLGSVHFVKQATKCQDCRLVVHPKCQGSVQATCGLPTEYIQHFAKIMDTLKSTEPNQLYPTLELEKSVKIQSWMKITRSNKSPWERKWLMLEGSLLMIFNEETDASPIDTFDLNPPNADVTVHSAVTTAELSSTVGTDLPFVIRLDMTPHTTCWPGRTLYLMTANFSDKQRWVATLEAAVSTCTSDKENRTNSSKLCGRTEIHLDGEKRLELNCCLALTEEIMLLGAEEGLFAYSTRCGKTGPVLVRFGGLDNVYQLTYVPALYQVLLITGKHRQILTLDKRVIEAKMREGNLDECVVIPSRVVEGTPGCTVFDVGAWNHAHYLCVGMAEKVVLMKYSSQHTTYIAKKDFNAPEPCSCICITNNYAIIGTYKFYRIDMEKMTVTEFVDSKDNSLAFAAFGAAIHHSYPLAIIRITDIGLPEEFLLCFHEFGVFVNGNGRRTRQGDMKWSGLPLGFVYREPFLYVTFFTSIQAIQIPAFSQELKVRQMHVSLPSPRFLGIARANGGVYFASTNRQATEVILFGDSGSNSPVKPLNFDLQRENIVEKDRQVRFVSPEVETSRASLRRSRSNSSLESCSSVYSISTLQSLDTNTSDWSPPSKRERLNPY